MLVVRSVLTDTAAASLREALCERVEKAALRVRKLYNESESEKLQTNGVCLSCQKKEIPFECCGCEILRTKDNVYIVQ